MSKRERSREKRVRERERETEGERERLRERRARMGEGIGRINHGFNGLKIREDGLEVEASAQAQMEDEIKKKRVACTDLVKIEAEEPFLWRLEFQILGVSHPRLPRSLNP